MTTLSRRTFVALLAATGSGPLAYAGRAVFQQPDVKTKLMDIISDDLRNWEKHRSLLPMADAFHFLMRADLQKLETGRQEIHGDDMYALVQRNQSRPIESAEFEAHRLYLDIQYLISGEEFIALTPQQGLTVSKPYDESKDIEFYLKPPQYQKIAMNPGRFAVFYPEHAHLPNCHPNQPGPLHKVVVKVKLQSIKK